MKVLVAFETSGRVRDAFAKRGHDAWSYDILPTLSPGQHIQGDFRGDHRDILERGWDLVVAHPPCTYLCVSGLHWNKRRPERAALTEAALDDIRLILSSSVPKLAFENPVGCISSRVRKPDQIIQPWQFGHDASKATCLWLKGLSKLVPTNVVEHTYHVSKTGRKWDKWWWDTCLLPVKGGVRADARSKTFQGIADAMAAQWG